MKTIIIYVNFKKDELTIKYVAQIHKSFFQETILEQVDLSTLDLVQKQRQLSSHAFISTMTDDEHNYLTAFDCQPRFNNNSTGSLSASLPSSMTSVQIDLKYKIKRWIDKTSANECVIDLTDVSHYEFKIYRNFIKENFSSFTLLHS